MPVFINISPHATIDRLSEEDRRVEVAPRPFFGRLLSTEIDELPPIYLDGHLILSDHRGSAYQLPAPDLINRITVRVDTRNTINIESLLRSPPLRIDSFFELSNVIDRLYGGNPPFENYLELLYDRFQSVDENDFLRFRQFLSQIDALPDLEQHREEILSFVTGFLQSLVVHEVFFGKAMRFVQVFTSQSANTLAFEMFLMKHLYESWIVMPAADISLVNLAKLLIGYQRIKNISDWWDARQGEIGELLPLLYCLKEDFDLPLLAYCFVSLPQDREQAIAIAAEECLQELNPEVTAPENIKSLLLRTPIWYDKLDAELAEEFWDLNFLEEIEHIYDFRTTEVVMQLIESSIRIS